MSSSTTTTVPLKHASDTDYTNAVIIFSTVLLVVSTLVTVLRSYARSITKNTYVGADDILSVLAWVGFLGNIIGNYLLAVNKAVSTSTPTASQGMVASKSIASVGITYPVSIVASKLSLLFLFRRVFGMRVFWFRVSWYIVFVLIFPLWFTLAITWGGLGLANKLPLSVELTYAVTTVTIINTITDVFMLLLPVGMTVKLQLSWKQRLIVIGIFGLGSAGTVVSLVRCVQTFQAKEQNWDSRYQLYSETMQGTAEAGAVLICACLPVMRPLFINAKNYAKSRLTTFQGTALSSSKHTRLSDSNDVASDALITLKDNVIHRRVDIDVDSASRDEAHLYESAVNAGSTRHLRSSAH